MPGAVSSGPGLTHRGEFAMDAKVVARFWSKVDKNGPVPGHCPELGQCWVWIASAMLGGYGRFDIKHTHHAAHRFSFAISNGEIPRGMVVMHRCDFPPCVRPSHLQIGTLKDNSADMTAKGRHGGRFGRGTGHWGAKLDDEQIAEIRKRRDDGASLIEIANAFRVTIGTASMVCSGKIWRHVSQVASQRKIE